MKKRKILWFSLAVFVSVAVVVPYFYKDLCAYSPECVCRDASPGDVTCMSKEGLFDWCLGQENKSSFPQCHFPLSEAKNSYKLNRDHLSLKVIHNHLASEMLQEEVEALLGEPDYSPTDGLFYYSSRKETISQTVKGLILDYRDENSNVTRKLKSFHLGLIGE